jgi:hypothetical protein
MQGELSRALPILEAALEPIALSKGPTGGS